VGGWVSGGVAGKGVGGRKEGVGGGQREGEFVNGTK
jgi:hypothetical protein